jgi:hypothetical protein
MLFFVSKNSRSPHEPQQETSTQHRRARIVDTSSSTSAVIIPSPNTNLHPRSGIVLLQQQHDADGGGDISSSCSISRRGFMGRTTLLLVGGVTILGDRPANAADDDSTREENFLDSLDDRLTLSTTTTTTIVATTASSSSTTTAAPPIDWSNISQKAWKKAIGGGQAGAAAAVVQVGALMWLRTSMNYQYRYGGTLQSSLQTLWDQGGITRLYQGLPFALVQGPLTRFGDTAANVGILALLETLPATQDWPLPLKTACGSAAAGLWRIVLSKLAVGGERVFLGLTSQPIKLTWTILILCCLLFVRQCPLTLPKRPCKWKVPMVCNDCGRVRLPVDRVYCIGVRWLRPRLRLWDTFLGF